MRMGGNKSKKGLDYNIYMDIDNQVMGLRNDGGVGRKKKRSEEEEFLEDINKKWEK